MFNPRTWADTVDLTRLDAVNSQYDIEGPALEAFSDIMTQREGMKQGLMPLSRNPNFKPVTITNENGLYYATIFVCSAPDHSDLSQSLCIWLATLKDTDILHLTVTSFLPDIPVASVLALMGALASTKAKVEIHLDQVVWDGLAYFYLIADKVIVGSAGAIFIPSYVDQRAEDTSVPWKAIHDFYQWVVEDAAKIGRLTAEEADKLNRGQHVILPNDRFSTDVNA